MKFNWGHGIALFYITFASVLVVFVIKSTFHDHSLVVENYYEEDLKYQQHYEKLANSKALVNDITINHNSEKEIIIIQFPKEKGDISGSILFYRPSDKSKDLKIEIEVDQDFEQSLPVSKLSSGLWKLKIDWQAGETPFYKEETVIL
jgi:nitrogen fixation protein FixH